MRTRHVVDYGIVANDPAKSHQNTGAIQRAIQDAGDSGHIAFPPWVISVDPDTLDFSRRRVTGAYAHTGVRTLLKAASGGHAVVTIARNKGDMADLAIDCDSKVEVGVSTDHAYPSLREVEVRGATEWAFDLFDSSGQFHRLYAVGNRRGIHVRGCNGSTFLDCASNANRGQGWEIATATVTRPDPNDPAKTITTTLGGECELLNCGSDLNLSDPADLRDPGAHIVIDGVEGGSWLGGYIEGAGSPLLLKGGTHNWTFAQLHCGPSGIRVDQAWGITFLGCAMSAPADNGPHVLVDVTPSPEFPRSGDLRFLGCYQMRVTQPWRVRFSSEPEGKPIQQWTAQVLGADLATATSPATPPPIGFWRPAERVWNGGPDGQQPIGWINVGTKAAVWKPLGYLRPGSAEAPTGAGTGAFSIDAADVWFVNGGQRHSLAGGYEGKIVTLVSTGSTAVDLVSLGRFDPSDPAGKRGNIYLSRVEPGGHVALAPGDTITLLRMTLSDWPDKLQPLTRWREIARA